MPKASVLYQKKKKEKNTSNSRNNENTNKNLKAKAFPENCDCLLTVLRWWEQLNSNQQNDSKAEANQIHNQSIWVSKTHPIQESLNPFQRNVIKFLQKLPIYNRGRKRDTKCEAKNREIELAIGRVLRIVKTSSNHWTLRPIFSAKSVSGWQPN